MIVQGFDKRNAALVMDGLELKAVWLLLRNLEKNQYEQAAYAMSMDGFTLSATDIAAYARHFQLVTNDVVAKMKKAVEIPDSSGLDEDELIN